MKKFVKIAAVVAIILLVWQLTAHFLAPQKVTGLTVACDGVVLSAEDMVYKEQPTRFSPAEATVRAQLDWLAEAMRAGLVVEKSAVSLTLGEDELVFQLHSSSATLNGEPYQLSADARREDGDIYVNMRPVVEALGWTLVYGSVDGLAKADYPGEIADLNIYSPEHWADILATLEEAGLGAFHKQ